MRNHVERKSSVQVRASDSRMDIDDAPVVLPGVGIHEVEEVSHKAVLDRVEDHAVRIEQ